MNIFSKVMWVLEDFFADPIIPTPEIGELWVRIKNDPFRSDNIAVILDKRKGHIQYSHLGDKFQLKHSEEIGLFMVVYEYKGDNKNEVES